MQRELSRDIDMRGEVLSAHGVAIPERIKLEETGKKPERGTLTLKLER
jgi:hypothetical protein